MENEKKQIPVEEGLFHIPSSTADAPYLIGSKCSVCGDVAFPKREVCPRCVRKDTMKEYHIYGKGKLNTYSIVNAALPDSRRPLSRRMSISKTVPGNWSLITGVEPIDKALKLGMDLELVVEKVREDAAGNDLVSYQFRPVQK